MRIPRLYLPALADLAMDSGERCPLGKDRQHYLARVLRRRPGDPLEVFDGQGRSAPAVLHADAAVHLTDAAGKDADPPLAIHLGLALSRGERMDMALQKATELGVASVQLLRTERVEVKLDSKRQARRLEHWQAVLASACEQCGRNTVPALAAPQQLAVWLASHAGVPTLLLHPDGPPLVEQPAPGHQLRLLTGPEGGFSPAELALAGSHGCRQTRLGPRVLRAETAPLAAVAVAQALWGDFATG